MATLKDQIREAARIAEESCTNGDFNAMSWLDDEIETNPGYFDELFDTPWHELSEDEQYKRIISIRRVL